MSKKAVSDRRTSPAVHLDRGQVTGRVPGVRCCTRNGGVERFRVNVFAPRRAIGYLKGNGWRVTKVSPGVYQGCS